MKKRRKPARHYPYLTGLHALDLLEKRAAEKGAELTEKEALRLMEASARRWKETIARVQCEQEVFFG